MPTPAGWGFIALIILSIYLAYRIIKRLGGGAKPGCLMYGYVSLVVFCCGLFALGISSIMILWTYNKADALINGQRYLAKVVDIQERDDEDSEGNRSTSYTSMLQIQLADGSYQTIASDHSSSSPDALGTELTISYNIANGRFVVFSGMTLIAMLGMLILCTVFVYAYVGMVYFAMGFHMRRFWLFTNAFFMLFFIPFLMTAFDALLIYALFYGNQVPLWAMVLLVFFIIVLSLATVAYIKHAIKKGPPKWKRGHGMSWTTDW